MRPGVVFGFEHAGWPAILVDPAGLIVHFNQAATKVFGPVLQAESTRLAQIWSQENPLRAEVFLERWKQQPAASNALKFNVRGIQISYTTVVCSLELDGKPMFVLQLFPDIGGGIGSSDAAHVIDGTGTMQKNKLDLALQLARSVSLDFNNALASVMGHSSLLLMKAEPEHPWRKSLLEIEKAAEKGAEIANSLRAFSRQEREVKPAGAGNLNIVLKNAASGMNTTPMGGPVKWDFKLEARLFQAKFDEMKVQQAFSRIFENAVQALSAGGGTIVVSTRNLELEMPTQDRNARLAPGSYVCTEIADTGCGIETAILPRIFEPFFTTKGGPKHRGLGLAWVYGVITNLGGGIAVSSKTGIGTSVRIYLPAEKQIVREPEVDSADLHGTETILLVDDEELVLNMAQEILESHGYKVVTASSGEKAARMLTNPEFKPDLLLTDLVMPGMSGSELANVAKGGMPGLRVLIMSGAIRAGDQADAGQIAKPFTSGGLLAKVKQALRQEG